ncbi:MAG: histidine triad nucleotide-binding protein [Thermotoga sp.]|nr:MAG: histidine triad nucleotide-binding protein [Thermotoga sp.]
MGRECVFCKIISGEVKSDKVYEDEDFIVIRDIKPVAPVHDLVIYKKHVPTILNMDDEDVKKFSRLFEVVKKVAELEGLDSFRLVNNNGRESGQEIDHIHFHIIGGRKLGGLG